MNILVINGSPKKSKSNTLRITNAFLRGIKCVEEANIKIINTIDVDVKPCKGCYCCWTRTPGKCIIKDDMQEIISLYIHADLVIWSFPNYHFGIPSTAKAVLDRLLPIHMPLINERQDGGAGHVGRYDLENQKYALISSCGFYSYLNNTEAIEKQFKILYGENCIEIICLEGDLFNYPALNFRTQEYLQSTRQAGIEFASKGYITKQTNDKLRNLHYQPQTFVKLANNSWDISTGASEDERKNIQFEKLINTMCYIYSPEYLSVDKAVLEICFYDFAKTAQIIFDKHTAKSVFNKNQFENYDLRIEAKFATWEKLLHYGTNFSIEKTVVEVSEYKTFLNWLSRIKKLGKRKVLSM